MDVGVSWPPLTTFISETMIVRSTLVDKCWQEISQGIKIKKTIKLRLEITSKNYGCWSLLVLSNLGSGKSYNSVAIFQTCILVVGPILETIKVIRNLLEYKIKRSL